MLTRASPHHAIEHGGEPGGPGRDWLDLSTGINQVPYPFEAPAPESWTRLPLKADTEALLAAAVSYYEAPGPEHLTAAPGSQALIQLLPRVFEPSKVQILGPTYGEHAVCWGRAGHTVVEIAGLEEADPAHVAIVVNPNNPDGRCYDRVTLIEAARRHSEAGSWLVVDEAFGDLVPETSAAPLVRDGNVIVLKSFGKFFGLAGLRLGFAVAPEALSETLRAEFGPWAISGPALTIAARALSDETWCQETRTRLASDAARLDAALAEAGFDVVGGTDLYRLIHSEKAQNLYAHLRALKIHVRRFSDHLNWLRFGLPAPSDEERLRDALGRKRTS
ncbi:MAG: threonine-phosphate decarboxylase CobD [Pseudomonadota bacterium]